jgi:hypothetical protein
MAGTTLLCGVLGQDTGRCRRSCRCCSSCRSQERGKTPPVGAASPPRQLTRRPPSASGRSPSPRLTRRLGRFSPTGRRLKCGVNFRGDSTVMTSNEASRDRLSGSPVFRSPGGSCGCPTGQRTSALSLRCPRGWSRSRTTPGSRVLPPFVPPTRSQPPSVPKLCACCPLTGAHSPKHPDCYIRWRVNSSTTLKRQDVPPRRTEIRLLVVVSAAQSLAVARDRWSSPRPGIDVVDLSCRIVASPPRKKHRGFASTAGPGHNRSPGCEFEAAPRIAAL